MYMSCFSHHFYFPFLDSYTQCDQSVSAAMGQMEVAKSKEENAKSGREVGAAELRDYLHQEQTMRVSKKAKVRRKAGNNYVFWVFFWGFLGGFFGILNGGMLCTETMSAGRIF